MTDTPSRIWKTGERLVITSGGKTLDGKVLLASSNGISLAIAYDGFLSPYPIGMGGYLPVLWTQGAFRDLMTASEVTLADPPKEEP